jgi:hypothetical protein
VICLDEFDVPEGFTNAKIIVENDEQAAEKFIELHSDKMKKSNGQMFVYDDAISTWCVNEKAEQVLKKLCLKSNIFKLDAKGNPKHYSGNMSGTNNIIDATMSLINESPDFDEFLFTQSIGKVFFADGYYDFVKQLFVPSLKPEDSLTTIRIHYKFPA